MTGCPAGNFRLIDDLFEIPPLGIPQKSLQLPGKPDLLAINLVRKILKILMQLNDDVTFHKFTSPTCSS